MKAKESWKDVDPHGVRLWSLKLQKEVRCSSPSKGLMAGVERGWRASRSRRSRIWMHGGQRGGSGGQTGRGRLELWWGEERVRDGATLDGGGARRQIDASIREGSQGQDSVGWQEPQEKRFCTKMEEAIEAQSVQGSLGHKETSHLRRSEGNYVSMKDRFNYKVAGIRGPI